MLIYSVMHLLQRAGASRCKSEGREVETHHGDDLHYVGHLTFYLYLILTTGLYEMSGTNKLAGLFRLN